MMIWCLFWYIFLFYLFLVRSIGLLSLGFDSKRYVFQSNSTLTIIYCVLVNLFYILLLPLCVEIKLADFKNRMQGMLLLGLNHSISLNNMFGFIVTLCNSWKRRSRLCCLLNKYARILRNYRKYFLSYEARAIRAETLRLLMSKLIASSCRLLMFYVYLYGQFERRPSMDFLYSSLLLGILETLMIYVDINIFLFILLTNTLLGIVVQQLRNIRQDVNLIYLLESKPITARLGCQQRHATWRLQLCKELRKLLMLKRRLQRLLKNMLRIYQWQLLTALFCSFMNHIAMLFHLFLYISEPKHHHLSFSIFLMFIVAANVWNLQLLFDTCERLTQRHREMRQQLEWMLTQFVQVGVGCLPNGAELKLQRSVELFLLELQQHGMHLKICGLFDLNRRAGHQMNRVTVDYFIVLVQMAVQQLKK